MYRVVTYNPPADNKIKKSNIKVIRPSADKEKELEEAIIKMFEDQLKKEEKEKK